MAPLTPHYMNFDYDRLHNSCVVITILKNVNNEFITKNNPTKEPEER